MLNKKTEIFFVGSKNKKKKDSDLELHFYIIRKQHNNNNYPQIIEDNESLYFNFGAAQNQKRRSWY